MAQEKQLENKIKHHLKSNGAWLIKYWGGGTMTVAGIPDILCCLNGIFIGIEVKSDVGKVSDLQKYHLTNIDRAGGIAVVVRPKTYEKFKNLIKEVNECNFHTANVNYLKNALIDTTLNIYEL